MSGSYFGEIEIFRKCQRLWSTRCETNTEFLIMMREAFVKILNKYPQIKNDIRKSAFEREEKIVDNYVKIQKLKGNDFFLNLF